MTFSVDQMKGTISSKGGTANPTLFAVQLPSRWGLSSNEINLICTRVNLPGKQIATYDKQIGGKFEKVAYNQIYGDVSMTFLLLNDYGIRAYFENWMNGMVDPDTYEPKYKNEYAAEQIKIQQLKKGIGLPVFSTPLGLPQLPSEIQNRLPSIGPFNLAQGTFDLDFITGDQVVFETTLYNAFPTTITDVDLSNSAFDRIIEFNVTFSYTKYTTVNREATPVGDFLTSGLGTILSRL